MQRGADRLKMPPVPESIFVDAVEQCVKANLRWLPPMGKGAMYVRPLLMGSGPILGVAPAPSYRFLVYVTPVGPYFKGGVKAIDLLISTFTTARHLVVLVVSKRLEIMLQG